MNDDTLIKTMPLPDGRLWEWFPDANVVVLAPGMCPAQQEEALNQVQAHWRRSCLRVLPTEPETRATQPLAMLSPRSG